MPSQRPLLARPEPSHLPTLVIGNRPVTAPPSFRAQPDIVPATPPLPHSKAWLDAAFNTARLVGLRCGPSLDLSPARRGQHGRGLVVADASIVDEFGAPIWWGDLDLEVDAPRLARPAAALGVPILVVGPWHGVVHGTENGFSPTGAIARFVPVGTVLSPQYPVRSG